jgi:hypothetical protein
MTVVFKALLEVPDAVERIRQLLVDALPRRRMHF